VARYADYYAVYRQLYPATVEQMHRLADLADQEQITQGG
jgi:hypothetical protein